MLVKLILISANLTPARMKGPAPRDQVKQYHAAALKGLLENAAKMMWTLFAYSPTFARMEARVWKGLARALHASVLMASQVEFVK